MTSKTNIVSEEEALPVVRGSPVGEGVEKLRVVAVVVTAVVVSVVVTAVVVSVVVTAVVVSVVVTAVVVSVGVVIVGVIPVDVIVGGALEDVVKAVEVINTGDTSQYFPIAAKYTPTAS